MTASPGDGEHAREGYYPDPSIPGYVRYWNGSSWVPGTSRPATPADGTGPLSPDRTGPTGALPERAPAAAWQADAARQSGFGGPRDERVSWGSRPERDPDPERDPERDPEEEPEQEPAGAAAKRGPGVSFARAGSPHGAAEGVGILSARSPAAAESPAWPSVPGGGPGSGLTSSWPEARPYDPDPPADARPEGAWPEPPAGGLRSSTPSPERPGRDGPEAAGGDSPQASDPDVLAAAARPAQPEGAWPEPPAGALCSTARPPERPGPGSTGLRETRPEAPAGGPPGSGAPATGRPGPQRTGGDAPKPSAPQAPAGDRPGPAARTPERSGADAYPDRHRSTGREVFEEMAERAVRPAGLPRRITARVLDSLVFGAVAAAAARPLVPAATAHLQAKVDAARSTGRTTTVWLVDGTVAGYLGLVLAAVLLFGVFYEALPTARWGRTPGKKLLGIRVLTEATLSPPGFGGALRRWLVYALFGLLGVLWCLGDPPRRRGLHDRAAGTYVSR